MIVVGVVVRLWIERVPIAQVVVARVVCVVCFVSFVVSKASWNVVYRVLERQSVSTRENVALTSRTHCWLRL